MNMEENTFTFTARSGANPDKSATFTLNNGTVAVELGNALVEQISKAYDSFSDEEAVQRVSSWFKPAATGTLQKMIEPISLTDFDAEMSGDALQTTAWIRAGGLRLAPVMMTWQDVDNPEGAQAFVDELRDRKEQVEQITSAPDPFDYWISWLVMGLAALAVPILLIRLMRNRQTS
jgi:hypothetical protein